MEPSIHALSAALHFAGDDGSPSRSGRIPIAKNPKESHMASRNSGKRSSQSSSRSSSSHGSAQPEVLPHRIGVFHDPAVVRYPQNKEQNGHDEDSGQHLRPEQRLHRIDPEIIHHYRQQ